jgi:hypothetical protein
VRRYPREVNGRFLSTMMTRDPASELREAHQKRVIVKNRLKVLIDGKKREVTITN